MENKKNNQGSREQKDREENAIVLDFLPHGYPFDNTPVHKKQPIVQAIGKEHFLLLELVPRKGVFLQPHKEVYIGNGKRDEISHIKGKILKRNLTRTAQQELEYVLDNAIKKNEKKYIDFFNKSRPLSTRMHQLELLPGVGKKHMWQIVEERDKEEFTSFEDIRKRVKLVGDPIKVVIKRILLEMEGKEKYNLFVQK